MTVYAVEYIAVDDNGYVAIADRFQDDKIGIPNLYTFKEPLYNYSASGAKLKIIQYNIAPGGISNV